MLARRYALEDELGRGGTGLVWRASDTVLQRTVVVRLLRPDLAEDPAFVARLAEQSSAVARIEAPGLVRLLDSGTDRGVSFLVREYVDGKSLRELLDRDGALEPAEAVRIVAGVLDALAVAHAAGLLHLGVTPENVLLGEGGRVGLADLGLGAAVRAARPSDASELLAPAPEPPELRDPSRVPDERADVYMVGALLGEALTGRPPAEGGPLDVPAPLGTLVERALAAEPERRFPSAGAFAEALRDATHDPAPPREGHGVRGWLLVPALVVGAAAVAIAVGLWLGRLELGGPLGVRAAEKGSRPTPSAPPSAGVLSVAAISTFDPYGDGSENDSGAPAAVDRDPATVWRSEDYFDGELRKAGIGLVLDLGAARTVTGFRLETPHAGWSFGLAVGDDPETLAAAAEPVFTAEPSMRGQIAAATGRYVLLWIVSVVDTGDGNRAEVAEIRVVGPDA